MLFKFIKPITAHVSAKPLPQPLDRVKFRRIWREAFDLNITGNNQPFRLVPSSLIHNQEKFIVLIRRGQPLQVNVHHFSVHPREKERESPAGMRRNARVQIKVLVTGDYFRERPLPFFRPKPRNVRLRPKTPFIEEKDRPFWRTKEAFYLFSDFF